MKPQGVEEIRRRHEPPSTMVRRLAVEKAWSIAEKFPEHWVIGADTTVVLGKEILEKPVDRKEAEKMILSLRGKFHWVLTGVALVRKKEGICETVVEKTKVTFSRFPLWELTEYLSTQNPLDKAGGYDIQGQAGKWIKGWEGEYFNVMGLPVQWLVQKMKTIPKCDSLKGR